MENVKDVKVLTHCDNCGCEQFELRERRRSLGKTMNKVVVRCAQCGSDAAYRVPETVMQQYESIIEDRLKALKEIDLKFMREEKKFFVRALRGGIILPENIGRRGR